MTDIMTGKELGQASAALMSWFESQGLSVPDAGGVLALTIGIIIGEAASSEDGLHDGLEALYDSVEAYALKHFKNK